jgi:hypothetical protein
MEREENVTTLALLGIIAIQAEVEGVEQYIKDTLGFVTKPAKGIGGKGIFLSPRSKMIVTKNLTAVKQAFQI